MLDSFYANISPTATTIIAIAIILFCGFAMTRITKLLKLPSVTAYIVVGKFLFESRKAAFVKALRRSFISEEKIQNL